MTDAAHRTELEHGLAIADGTHDGVTAQYGGTVRCFPINHVDHATETIVFVNAKAVEFVRMDVLKKGADAGGTVQLKTAAHTAITDAVAAAVDKALTSSGTIDPAQRVIPAGTGFEITFTKGSGAADSEVLLYFLLR